MRYSSAGRVITVLGTGNPLTNGSLARQGNAALALNLLGTRSRVVWLVPGLGLAGAAGGQKSLTQLIPLPAYLVVIQLCIAVVLAALWRAPQTRAAGGRAAAGRGAGLGDRRRSCPALPVAPRQGPVRGRAAGRDAGPGPARAGAGS